MSVAKIIKFNRGKIVTKILRDLIKITQSFIMDPDLKFCDFFQGFF